MQYLKTFGIEDKPPSFPLARAIILGTAPPKRPAGAGTGSSKDAGSKDAGTADAGVMSEAAAIKKVSDDLAFMKKSLAALGVHEWGGVAGQDPGPQGWEGESEPKEAQKEGLMDTAVALFKDVADKVKPGVPRSLVLLAHDTPAEPEPKGGPPNRVQKVAQDMKVMEAYALSKNVRIEYVTMSDLYTKRVGSAP